MRQYYIIICFIYFKSAISWRDVTEHVRENCYGPHSVTPSGVPNTKHSSYLSQDYQTRRLTLKRTIFLGPSLPATTRTLTPATLTNPSHNSRNARVHPPSQATTQGMSIRATTQGMSRVYSLSQGTTQGIPFRATTQGTLQQVDL